MLAEGLRPLIDIARSEKSHLEHVLKCFAKISSGGRIAKFKPWSDTDFDKPNHFHKKFSSSKISKNLMNQSSSKGNVPS